MQDATARGLLRDVRVNEATIAEECEGAVQSFLRAALFVAIVAIVAIVASSDPVSARQYQHYDTDYPTTSNGNVGVYQWPNRDARAEIRWYNDTSWRNPATAHLKGIFFNTYIVGNGRGGGCIFARVIWETIDIGVGWPPSVSAGRKEYSDGYVGSCRPNPNAAIPYIKLGGQNYQEGVTFTSRGLQHVVLEVCQGTSLRGPKINCTADRFSYGHQ